MIDMTETTGVDYESLVFEQPITEAEAILAVEIATLWNSHKGSKAAVRRTREELKTIRRDLSQKLHAMKSILARTGRGGGWAGYLRSNKLPRATADRYVLDHEAILAPPLNRLSEAVAEPTEDEVRRFAQKLLPRLCRSLTTSNAIYFFFDELVSHLPPVTDRAEEVSTVTNVP
jgi:hypothetical protein